jgi:hypothetical protein
MRLVLTKQIDLKHCPEIMRLAQEGEELKDLTITSKRRAKIRKLTILDQI